MNDDAIKDLLRYLKQEAFAWDEHAKLWKKAGQQERAALCKERATETRAMISRVLYENSVTRTT